MIRRRTRGLGLRQFPWRDPTVLFTSTLATKATTHCKIFLPERALKRKPPRHRSKRSNGRRAYGATAQQYNKPAPPVLTRFSWRQPRLGCAEFHDVFGPPVRSKWPSCAVPSPLLLQFWQVWSGGAV